jgi:hypothetical protein
MGAAAELAGGTGLFTGAASMDLQKAIRDLYEEKARIDGVIASLEQYLRTNGAVTAKRKRGRKSMGAEERQEVSARMRSYWASRRTGAES